MDTCVPLLSWNIIRWKRENCATYLLIHMITNVKRWNILSLIHFIMISANHRSFCHINESNIKCQSQKIFEYLKINLERCHMIALFYIKFFNWLTNVWVPVKVNKSLFFLSEIQNTNENHISIYIRTFYQVNEKSTLKV